MSATSPLMKCGHAANSLLTVKDGTKIPACVICMGTHPGAAQVDDSPPDLSERTARCAYYGSTPKGRSHESNHGCKRGEPCKCEVPSSGGSNPEGVARLAFFEHKPDAAHDRFYCGCWGWD